MNRLSIGKDKNAAFSPRTLSILRSGRGAGDDVLRALRRLASMEPGYMDGTMNSLREPSSALSAVAASLRRAANGSSVEGTYGPGARRQLLNWASSAESGNPVSSLGFPSQRYNDLLGRAGIKGASMEKTALKDKLYALIGGLGALSSTGYFLTYLRDRADRKAWEKKLESQMSAAGYPSQAYIPDSPILLSPMPKAASVIDAIQELAKSRHEV